MKVRAAPFGSASKDATASFAAARAERVLMFISRRASFRDIFNGSSLLACAFAAAIFHQCRKFSIEPHEERTVVYDYAWVSEMLTDSFENS